MLGGANVSYAFAIMRAAHGKQLDKAGHPYWLHPVQVMLNLGPTATEDERITALLHDVIEDTDWTLDDLRERGFSSHVLAALRYLTKWRGDGYRYDHYIRDIAESGLPIAVHVKIADMLHNSSPARLAALSPADQGRLRAKYTWALGVLTPVWEKMKEERAHAHS